MSKSGAQQLEEIVANTDSHDARIIWNKVFLTFEEKCWLAFLNDPFLNACLTANDLQGIMWVTKLQLKNKKASNPNLLVFSEILPTIAQNLNWCRMLGGYHYFLKYVKYDNMLAQYLANNVTFMRQLSEDQVAMFASDARLFITNILKILIDAMQYDIEAADWAIKSLKCIFMTQRWSREILCLDDNYSAISRALLDLFETDVEFAFDVLKDQNMCQYWVKKGFDSAYKHPLFGANEYSELENYYRIKKPRLAGKYKILVRDTFIKKFGEFIIDDSNKHADPADIPVEQNAQPYLPLVHALVNKGDNREFEANDIVTLDVSTESHPHLPF
jgi:hypothetical protein